jgi:hypothetical protein
MPIRDFHSRLNDPRQENPLLAALRRLRALDGMPSTAPDGSGTNETHWAVWSAEPARVRR